MTEKQTKILKLLWDFQSLREIHIIKICDCTIKDIDYLVSQKILIRDKDTKIIRYQGKEINNRNIIAFDIVMEYLDRNPEIKKGNRPVNVTLKTGFVSYDIIAIKENEIDNLFKNINNISSAEKIIIIIQTKHYIKKKINTDRECMICTYSPLEIVDIINEDTNEE